MPELLLRNTRLALRRMRSEPGPAIVIILTLALTTGAATTVFTFVNALLLRPFPFRDSDRLVQIHSVRGDQAGKLSMREVLDLRERVPSLSAVAAHTGSEGGYNFSGEGRPEEWKTVLNTGDLFEVLGVPLALGKTWPTAADRSRDYNVVLSYKVWQSSFGGRRDVVGSSITLDHAPGYTVRGVAARSFDFPHGIQIYRSLGGFALYDRRDYRNVFAVGRLRPGSSLGELRTQLTRLSGQLATEYPESNRGLALQAERFRDLYSGDVRIYLWLLLGAVLLVLFMACANTANILLSRALGKRREFALRSALGAGRLELAAQMLIESMVLATFASAAGVLLSLWWVKVLRGLIGYDLPDWMAIDLDTQVLLFAAALTVVAALVSGMAPALNLSAHPLMMALREGDRGSSSGGSASRFRSVMIVAQVAIAIVLLSGAGLLISGFSHLQSQTKGFQSDGLSTFRVALGWKRYITRELETRYYEQAIQLLEGRFGRQNVGLVNVPPLAGQERTALDTVQIEGQAIEEARSNPYVNRLTVSESYFSLLQIPLQTGRLFEKFDGPAGEPVAIVGRTLARRLWPGENPIGKRIRYAPFAKQPEAFRRVVGVVADVQQGQLGGDPGLDLYVNYRQAAEANQYLLVRTHNGLRQFQSQAERLLWSIDSQQSVFDFKTYDERILEGIWQLRLSRLILILFGAVGLVIASLGIYGVMSYLVGQRAREMGVRLALGASPQNVRWLVISSSAGLTALGLLLGLVVTVSFGRLLHQNLRSIPSLDVGSLLLSASILLGVAVLAAALPAWRASRVDPAIALREE